MMSQHVLRSLLMLAVSAGLAGAQAPQSAREIPVVHEVDVVVVGGSTGAVAAAVAASREGAKVFLAAPKTYLGEDMAATLRLWLEKDEKPAGDLAMKVYSDWGETPTFDPVRPLHVKKTLDEALLAAKVPYLFSAYATDVLRDAQGRPAGVVIANRAGRQAVTAKVIIDATARGWVARMAGAEFRPSTGGRQEFRRYVVGGAVKNEGGVKGRTLPVVYRGDGTLKARTGPETANVPVIEYTLSLEMADGSFQSFAKAEQAARDLTFDAGQLAAAEDLFQVPPDTLRAAGSATGTWRGVERLPVEVFQPRGMANVYVLGGTAMVSREMAAKLLRPVHLMAAGERVGAEAAKQALKAPAPAGVRVAAGTGKPAVGGDVKEILTGLRPVDRGLATVPSVEQAVPVLGSYDVVVVGGGTGGAPAGIAAARAGSKVLVVEYLDGMGGVGTMGRIARYWWGYRGGFTNEVPGIQPPAGKGDNPRFDWNPLHKSEWLRRTLREAGGEVWYGVMGAGALVEGKHVKGVVVATPGGRGVVLAKTVIDATGNADIAAAAGAPTVQSGAAELAVQGTGLPSINLGSGYTNTDFTITDETDAVDTWHMLVYAKNKYSTQFDMGQLIDSRERRRIVGDIEMSILDQMLERTYPDTVARAYSNFDTHGYTVDPYFLLEHPEKQGFPVDLPYRTFLPKGFEGILTIGLGMSVHRDALPLVRMQPDIQNHGYAMGLAAATAAKQNKTPRQIDLKELQKQLVQMEIIPQRALTDKDSFPLSNERIAEAIRDYAENHKNAAVILSHPEQASPLLREAYQKAQTDKDKLTYAMILAVLGDASGLDTIASTLDAQPWDAGWRYTGMGQFGGALSPVDRYIVALGRTRDKRALPVILKKLEQLKPEAEFSHHRAIALALEMIGDPAAAAPLAKLLRDEEVAGWTVTDVDKARKMSGLNVNETQSRGLSIRELALARALLKCGDHDGLGRAILERYAKDLRGHVARHAQAVLDEARVRQE